MSRSTKLTDGSYIVIASAEKRTNGKTYTNNKQATVGVSLPKKSSLTVADVGTNTITLNITNPVGKTLKVHTVNSNGTLSIKKNISLTSSNTTLTVDELSSNQQYRFEVLSSSGTVEDYVVQGTGNDADGKVNIQDYLTNLRFNNRWGTIDYIRNGILSVKCNIVNNYTGTTCEYIQVSLPMQEYSGSYCASEEDICEALGYYFNEKSTRGIYVRQWTAEMDGIFYDVSGMGQYDVFGGKNGPVDITTYINNMGPQWEAIYMAKTNVDCLNDLQRSLDLCSCFPVVFIPVQGANILISFARGNTKEALIRVGAVAVVGIAAKVVSVAVSGALKSACGSDTALMNSTVAGMVKAYQKSGLTSEKINQILSTAKGTRPNPSSYLPSDYIASHLAKFNGGVTKISATAPTGIVGPPGGTFVMPKSVADDLIARAAGNVSKLEEFLSLESGTLGANPVRIDVFSPSGLRMSSGNELGANSQWLPGGYTGGGITEATIDQAQVGTYVVNSIFN